MADSIGGNAGYRVESNKTSPEFENEAMSWEDLNDHSDTVSRVDHEYSAGFFNVNYDSSFIQKVKLDVGESEENDASTEEESAIVGNDGIEDKNDIFTNGAVENGKVHSGNGSVPFQHGDINLGDEEISVKDGAFEEENGVLDIENNNKEVKDVRDAGNEVEESGLKAYEHQAVETETVETDSDNSNGRSLEREEDGALADVAESAELEENVKLEAEQEEKAKSELASENVEVVTVADKLDDVSTDSNSVMNDSSASGEGEPPKPVKEEPVKTRSWRDIAVDGIESIPDKVQFRSRNPLVRRYVPKFVKSVVRSGDLKSKIELKVSVTRSINNARSSESVSNINEQSSFNDLISEEKGEQVTKQKDCKLETEAEKGHENNVGADLFAKSKGLDIGQKNTNTSTIAGIDKEEQVKRNKRKKEKEDKARKEEELRKGAEEEKRIEEEAKKERLRKEDEAVELRKKLIDEEMEKMRMAEERKKKKAEKAQKRVEYKAQKEAEEKEKKKAKKQKKKSGTSDSSSVSSEVTATCPEKSSPDASSHDPETSRSAVLKRHVVLPSSKKKANIPKDPLPMPLALRNRSKGKWLKGIMWSMLVVSVVLMLFISGNYVSSESLFKSFTF